MLLFYLLLLSHSSSFLDYFPYVQFALLKYLFGGLLDFGLLNNPRAWSRTPYKAGSWLYAWSYMSEAKF